MTTIDQKDVKKYTIIPENPDSKFTKGFEQLKNYIETQKDNALERQANKRGDKKY